MMTLSKQILIVWFCCFITLLCFISVSFCVAYGIRDGGRRYEVGA